MSRTVTLGVCLAAAVVVAAGTASAIPLAGGRTDVGFVPITGHAVLTNAYVLANGGNSPVVIGGTTTVPSDATRVQLQVSVKGSASGSLRIYPAGDLADAQSEVAPWTATKLGRAIVTVSPGTSDRVTFVNVSARPINLTVTITGYSTQVTAGDVNSSGGSPGQVLTDTGNGAAWQNPGTVYLQRVASTDLGFDTSYYVTAPQLPAGSYLVQFSTTIRMLGAGASTVTCELHSSDASSVLNEADSSVDPNAPDASLAFQSVAVLGVDGFIGVHCSSTTYTELFETTFTAMPIGRLDDQSS
jgi:hypothetical protein